MDSSEIAAEIAKINERLGRLEGSIGVCTVQRTINIDSSSGAITSIEAVGNDTDIDLELIPKGDGSVAVTRIEFRDSDDNRLGGFTGEDL